MLKKLQIEQIETRKQTTSQKIYYNICRVLCEDQKTTEQLKRTEEMFIFFLLLTVLVEQH
jgi:hypothetical protein